VGLVGTAGRLQFHVTSVTLLAVTLPSHFTSVKAMERDSEDLKVLSRLFPREPLVAEWAGGRGLAV
jgi:hypothetical protein